MPPRRHAHRELVLRLRLARGAGPAVALAQREVHALGRDFFVAREVEQLAHRVFGASAACAPVTRKLSPRRRISTSEPRLRAGAGFHPAGRTDSRAARCRAARDRIRATGSVERGHGHQAAQSRMRDCAHCMARRPRRLCAPRFGDRRRRRSWPMSARGPGEIHPAIVLGACRRARARLCATAARRARAARVPTIASLIARACAFELRLQAREALPASLRAARHPAATPPACPGGGCR